MIELYGVGARYGDGPVILSNVTLKLRPGSFHFLTGPSGSGKSSLLRLLTMSLPPSTGTLRILEVQVNKVSPAKRAALRRRIGVVIQDFLMLEYLIVFENVALPLHILGKRPADYWEDVNELLQWVGLGDKMSAYPQALSGGEKQRAAVARAVIGKPEILLADEPTGSVDPDMATRLLRLFVELNRYGMTVLLATHDVALMRQLKAPHLKLRSGNIVTDEESR